MAFGAGRLAEGRNQDEFRIIHLLLRRRRWLREVSPRSGVSSCLLLRICGMLEGIVVRPNMVLVVIPCAGRGLFGGRSETSIGISIAQSIRNKVI
jgi:hypothetical protein